MPEEWKECITEPIHKNGDKTDCSNDTAISFWSTTCKILFSILLSRLTPYAEKIVGNNQCGLYHDRSSTDHIFCICKILEKKWGYIEAVHQLYTDFKKDYDSVSRNILHNILFEFCIPWKLVLLLIMCLNETYSRVQVGKHLSYMFHITNSFENRRHFTAIAFQICFRVCHYEGSGEPGWLEIKWYTSTFGLC